MKGGAKGPILAAIAGLLACPAPVVSRSWPTMATYATVVVRGEDERQAERTTAAVRAVFDRVERAMSNWSPDSELARLNRDAASGPYRIEDEGLASCVERALEGADATGSAFDPTVGPLMTLWGFRPRAPRVPEEPEIAEALTRVGARKVTYDPATRTIRFAREGMEIDLGGIAKGCALDEARRAVAGVEVDLDLGGQWAFQGGGRRRTGIADPFARDKSLGEVAADPADSIATSSDSENHFEAGGKSYGHVMDPRTGRPAATDVVQATVLDPSATTAEVLGKALMVVGSAHAGALLRSFPKARAILVVREGERLVVLASPALSGRLSLVPDGRFAADSPRMLTPP